MLVSYTRFSFTRNCSQAYDIFLRTKDYKARMVVFFLHSKVNSYVFTSTAQKSLGQSEGLYLSAVFITALFYVY